MIAATATVILLTACGAGHLTTPAPELAEIGGAWILNLEQSDNPRETLRAGAGLAGGQTEGGRGGRSGGRSAGGRGGQASGGRGGPRGGRGNIDREAMQESLEMVMESPRWLEIVRTDSSVTLAGGTGTVLSLRPDGKRMALQRPSGRELAIRSRWAAAGLVVEYKIEGGAEIRETYFGAPMTDQLYVLVEIDMGPRTLKFRRVYDPAEQAGS